MRIIYGIAAVVAVGGCAPGAMTSPTAYAPSDAVFTGWVRFIGEEFQLYANENQVLQPFSRPCVSGALPRDLQRQAASDLGGQKVRVTGRTQAWPDNLPGDRLDHQGSNIRNECGGTFVILADAVSPAR